MVLPRRPADRARVAAHYDVLDRWYREIWGEHVHHGLWATGLEWPEEAALNLARAVADLAGIGAGSQLVDVGCGYGATARLLARERGARVTAVTLSRAQWSWAAALPRRDGDPEYVHADWLAGEVPAGAFDAAIAIESLSHMADAPRAFGELGRVVRPGGRVVVVDWLVGPRAGRRAERAFTRPICEEGHLPALRTPAEYAALLRGAGFELVSYADERRRVWRTWAVVVRRLAARLAADPAARAELLSPVQAELRFGLSLARIPAALLCGTMAFGVFAATRR